MEITGGNWRQPELTTQKPRRQPEPTGINHPTRSQMEITGGNWRQPGTDSSAAPEPTRANRNQPSNQESDGDNRRQLEARTNWTADALNLWRRKTSRNSC